MLVCFCLFCCSADTAEFTATLTPEKVGKGADYVASSDLEAASGINHPSLKPGLPASTSTSSKGSTAGALRSGIAASTGASSGASSSMNTDQVRGWTAMRYILV